MAHEWSQLRARGPLRLAPAPASPPQAPKLLGRGMILPPRPPQRVPERGRGQLCLPKRHPVRQRSQWRPFSIKVEREKLTLLYLSIHPKSAAFSGIIPEDDKRHGQLTVSAPNAELGSQGFPLAHGTQITFARDRNRAQLNVPFCKRPRKICQQITRFSHWVSRKPCKVAPQHLICRLTR